MAYDIRITGAYAGRPNYTLELYVRRDGTSGNSSRYAWELIARRNGGSLSYLLDPQPWGVNVGGQMWSGAHNLDFRSTSQISLGSGVSNWIAHDDDGNLTIVVDAVHQAAGPFGWADPPATNFETDRIKQAPSKPQRPTFDSATTTSIAFRITTAGIDNGGAALTGYDFQASRNAAFTDIARTWSAAAGSGQLQTATPLDPGTDYWIRFRAKNSVGRGTWSDALGPVSTMPAVPPGILVTPNLAGTEASVALTPPAGVSSVTSYRVERRAPGGAVTVYNTSASPLLVPGLTPGLINEWRASAFIGTYQTPWTDWAPVIQPNPNTAPGDYFDGSSATTEDVTFAWSGATNNSTSTATGVTPEGWAVADFESGGAAVVQRVTGGRSGAFGARVTMTADATGAGVRAGQSEAEAGFLSDVAEGGGYVGSIYVWPVRTQRLAAEVTWLDASLDMISRTVGDPSIVASGDFTRLVVNATAPMGAVFGAVRVIDVAGDGHAPWLSGESWLMDDAALNIGGLFPWFSGDTPDTAQFTYEWLGDPNASASIRTALPEGGVDPLADPDCPPVPAAPTPPPIADDCIDEVGTWRRYWAIVPADQVSQWLDIVPTIRITTGALAARQVRIRVHRNPGGVAPADFDASNWDAEQIISYMPPATVITLDGVARRVWATVGDGEERAADRLLYGTGGGPATWPVLDCGTAYLISFDVPLDAPEGNLSVGVSLTTRAM